jgi:hypothetical protein
MIYVTAARIYDYTAILSSNIIFILYAIFMFV